ncbi:DUF2332 domain-containing protein [Microbispora triticiradicis]|uniref:DUF2332 domain-containing protein n=1 Tax=Microbispora triticiradicis TaxID=2200763 RepID=UPI001AD68BEF|nr:DUF2332 domain-containing protein [Microbispora triticiradicis]MBO4274692.1 DUF2332 family protein [Microbispora triticiradicis]
METAEWYRYFAEREARGHSPVYEVLGLAVAADPGLLELVDGLPEPKRQPNLLFAAVRFLGGPYDDFGRFHAWTVRHWDRVRETVLARRTQTNETGRCASLLPVLAALPGPLALIEVGASAGLCLYPDRYRYRYDDPAGCGPEIGPAASPVLLTCRTNGGVPVPDHPPEIVWRVGIDLDPVDVRDDEAVRWLECLVWPGQDDRLARLRGAVRMARRDPPRLVRGDASAVLPGLVAAAPAGATVVVFHSALMPYLDAGARNRFVALVRGLRAHGLPVRWISNEGAPRLPSVLAGLTTGLPGDRLTFLTALDGRPLAMTGPHGEWLDWLA